MKKQLLVVDDEPSILKLLSFVLSKEYDLIIKNSGVEAISWLEDGNDPALVISDLEMPHFDGNSFIRNLKISGFYRHTPVIVLSGTQDLQERIGQMDYVPDAYIPKPFNPAFLKAMIIHVLGAHESAA